jgi:curved DNA-binding protein CbpA
MKITQIYYLKIHRFDVNYIFFPNSTIEKTFWKKFHSMVFLFSTYYEILGVNPKADANTIKKAFLQKAKKMHPDINKTDKDAQKKFVELLTAYDVLKDSNKRKAYDEQLKYSSQTFNQSSNINYENLRFFIQKS